MFGSSVSATRQTPSTGQQFYAIGATDITNGGNGNYFSGSIDDVRIYNRALSTQEIKQLYADGTTNIAHSNPAVANNGLVGYWPFDGNTTNWATGTTQDISGNNNTGQLIGMSTTTSPTAGKIGSALNFRLNKSISIADNTSLDPTAALTVAGWVYPRDIIGSSYPTLVEKNRNAQYGFVLDYADSGAYSGTMRAIIVINGVRQDCVSPGGTGLINNKWQFVTFTYDGNKIRIYKNGIDQNATTGCTVSGSIGTSNATLSVGKLSDFAGFIGTIDDVRIYNRALSAQEISQLYLMGK